MISTDYAELYRRVHVQGQTIIAMAITDDPFAWEDYDLDIQIWLDIEEHKLEEPAKGVEGYPGKYVNAFRLKDEQRIARDQEQFETECSRLRLGWVIPD